MKHKRNFLLLILFLAVSVSGYSQQKNSKTDELSKKADVILKGKVTEKNAAWNENKSRIFTKVTLHVDEYLKGEEKKETIEITHLGGEVGDVGEIYSHVPTFEVDEEVLVFLKKDKKNNRYEVLHGQDGKIKIVKEIKK